MVLMVTYYKYTEHTTNSAAGWEEFDSLFEIMFGQYNFHINDKIIVYVISSYNVMNRIRRVWPLVELMFDQHKMVKSLSL